MSQPELQVPDAFFRVEDAGEFEIRIHAAEFGSKGYSYLHVGEVERLRDWLTAWLEARS